MNLYETGHLLAMIQTFDRRTVGETDIVSWQSLLTDVDLADAQEAVRRHFAESTDWLMPAHLRRAVRDIERERDVEARLWAPGQYGVPKDEALPELARGERLTVADLSPRVADLLSQLRAELPEVPREKLFPRQTYWERQQRTFRADAAPNPHYRPSAADEALRMAQEADIIHATRIADCRTNGPHDDGFHIETCPDAKPVECCGDWVRCRPEKPCGAGAHHWEDRPARFEVCATCGCESQDLAQHLRDYPNGSCR